MVELWRREVVYRERGDDERVKTAGNLMCQVLMFNVTC